MDPPWAPPPQAARPFPPRCPLLSGLSATPSPWCPLRSSSVSARSLSPAPRAKERSLVLPRRGAGAAPLTWDSGCRRAARSPTAQRDGRAGRRAAGAQLGSQGGLVQIPEGRVWSPPRRLRAEAQATATATAASRPHPRPAQGRSPC